MKSHDFKTTISQLNNEINITRNKLGEYPPGHLCVLKNGKKRKWFHSGAGPRKYIPKSNGSFASLLADKALCQAHLEDLCRERDALLSYESFYDHYSSHEEALRLNPLYKDLISSELILNESILQWKNEPFQRNTEHPENLIYHCVSGNIVRSKSEALIDNILFMHNLPYRYECALNLGGFIIYPDFTIMHPRTGALYYHEHFGRMDDPKYAGSVFRKQERYYQFGIIPGINLLMTFESSTNPLDIASVEHYIIDTFLS